MCVCVCERESGWVIYNALIYNELFIKDNSLVHKLWKQLGGTHLIENITSETHPSDY